MPITQSAKKALRQSRRRAARNSAQKKTLRMTVKEFKKSLATPNQEGARQQLSRLYQALDKAVKGSILKKNTASRMKSRLTRQLQK